MNRTEIADFIHKGGMKYLEKTLQFPWRETIKNEQYLNSYIVRSLSDAANTKKYDYLVGFEITLKTLLKINGVEYNSPYNPKFDVVIFKNNKPISIIEIKRFTNGRVYNDFEKLWDVHHYQLAKIGTIKHYFLGFRVSVRNKEKIFPKFDAQWNNILNSGKVPSEKIEYKYFDKIVENDDGHFTSFGVIHWST